MQRLVVMSSGDSSHHQLQSLPMVHAQTMLVCNISYQDQFCGLCLMAATGLGSHETKSAPPHLCRCRQGCMYLPPQLLTLSSRMFSGHQPTV